MYVTDLACPFSNTLSLYTAPTAVVFRLFQRHHTALHLYHSWVGWLPQSFLLFLYLRPPFDVCFKPWCALCWDRLELKDDMLQLFIFVYKAPGSSSSPPLHLFLLTFLFQIPAKASKATHTQSSSSFSRLLQSADFDKFKS